jgi:murein DD-endopeptidase MepM/ murein hydrolase activator NlpD/PKD repeat protein
LYIFNMYICTSNIKYIHMKKITPLLIVFAICSLKSNAQAPYFKELNDLFQIKQSNAVLQKSKINSTLVKMPNVFIHPSLVSSTLVIPANHDMFQATINNYKGNYAILEREEIGNNYSFYLYDKITNVKTVLFTNTNSPIANRAIKPLGFISANIMLVEAFIFDSGLFNDGVYTLDITTLKVTKLNITANYMCTPLLNETGTVMYYSATTDAVRDLIHGKADLLYEYNLSTHTNTLVYKATKSHINFMGWPAISSTLQLQHKSLKNVNSALTSVIYILPFDNLGEYYCTRSGTPTTTGPHVSTNYNAAYSGFTPHTNYAIDFATSPSFDENIRASAPGIVTKAGWDNFGYGNLVIIKHADGMRSLYAHNSSIFVNVGDCVGYGDILSLEGTTGNSTGDHLHYEWRTFGTNINSEITLDDVGQPVGGYSYTSHTPTLACGVNTPYGPSDNTQPTTQVLAPLGWNTTNFITNFNDADNAGGSGIDKTFYQVADNNTTQWRSNHNRGFFADGFNESTINTAWTSYAGNWSINNNGSATYLNQSDESNNNTSISAYVNPFMSDQYLYQFNAKFEGSGNNRRGGLHYFSDSPSLSNRGNGYFAFFRIDDNQIEIYKVTNDVFTQQKVVNYPFTAGDWYDFKITYDKTNGKSQVFVGDILACDWTDPSHYTSGDFVSFRSGNCSMSIDNFNVYRSRNSNPTITVGSNEDIRVDNPYASFVAGRIWSLVTDVAGNVSQNNEAFVNVDASSPSSVNNLNDGNSTDIDFTPITSTFNANWTAAADPNSDIAKYYYALGTTVGGGEIISWTDNGTNTSVALSGLSLVMGVKYYVSVKSQNGAGLQSSVATSDGLTIQSNQPSSVFTALNTTFCSNDSAQYNNQSVNANAYKWLFPGGLPATSTLTNPKVYYATSGTYTATLIAYNGLITDTTTQSKIYTVNSAPVAVFVPSATTVAINSGSGITFNNISTNATSYSWNFGNGFQTSLQNPVYTYTTPGTYTVVLTATNGLCGSDTSTAIIYVTQTISINDIANSLNNYKLHFNNTTNCIYIQSATNSNEQLQLITIDGKIIVAETVQLFDGATTSIPIKNNVSAGVYLVKVGLKTIKINIGN